MTAAEARLELIGEAIRGFLLEKHVPWDEIDAWADDLVAIVREHEVRR